MRGSQVGQGAEDFLAGDFRHDSKVKRTPWAYVLFSVALFVVSFSAMAVLGPSESGGYHTCILEEAGKIASEGQVIRWERSLWPPGIRCTYINPRGPDVSIVRPVTVAQVGFLALLCCAAGTLAACLVQKYRLARTEALALGHDGDESALSGR